jgi:hypothetical protein
MPMPDACFWPLGEQPARGNVGIRHDIAELTAGLFSIGHNPVSRRLHGRSATRGGIAAYVWCFTQLTYFFTVTLTRVLWSPFSCTSCTWAPTATGPTTLTCTFFPLRSMVCRVLSPVRISIFLPAW